jgi:hypothetical protein
MTATGIHSADCLQVDSLPPAVAAMPLADLGLQAQDIVTVETSGGDRHYLLSGRDGERG